MNRKLVLALLLAVLALSLAYAFSSSPRQERAAAPAGRASARPAAVGEGKAAAPTDNLRVKLEVLARHGEPFPGIRRNLFGSLVTVAPPPPPPPPPPPVAPVMPPPVVVEPPALERVLQQELARFVYLGFLQKGTEKTVFLSSANEIFVVKAGDRFGGSRQFLVRDLAADRLIIQQGDDPRPIVISLAEQSPLAPAVPATPLSNYRRGSRGAFGEGSRVSRAPTPPRVMETEPPEGAVESMVAESDPEREPEAKIEEGEGGEGEPNTPKE